MHYTFRTLKEDSDIDELLMSLPPKKRPEFIRNALKFYIQNKDFLYSLEKDIEEIKDELALLKEHLLQKDEKKEFASTDNNRDKNKTNPDELFDNLINQFLNI